MILHKTTKTHYNRYEELAKKVTNEDIERFLKKSRLDVKTLRKKWKADPFLLNIDDRIFDNNIHEAAKHDTEIVELTNVCLWKHVLIYRVLGATPKFISADNFVKELRD